jgi:hypothetical protein
MKTQIKGGPHNGPYPHQGSCPGCYDARPRLCNVCGRKREHSLRGGGCTNGRCADCHAKHCTPGGNTSPGHGFGDIY